MVQRRPPVTAALTVASAACYALNCALGTSVALGIIDTRGFRWVHHAIYIATTAATAAAVAAGLFGRHRRDREAALTLAPALVPLAVIPFAGSHGPRHPLVALAAAPFLLAGVAGAVRPHRAPR